MNFLDEAPLFSGLTDELRSEIAELAQPTSVSAGEWLFRAGDAAASLFVVASGRLEVLIEEPHVQVLRVLGRGATVGELALLSGDPRSASVRARRDSELFEIAGDDFARLLASKPDFAIALTRALGAQLQASRSLGLQAAPRPITIVLVPLDEGLDVHELGESLRAELGGEQRVALIPGDGPEGGSRAELLDRLERESEQVVMVADQAPTADAGEWTDFCMRQADRVLAVTRGGPVAPWVAESPSLRSCDVVFTSDAPPSSLVPWRDAVDARAVHLLGANGLARLARRLAGRSLGVVLSGGGARGFAHIGALEVLEAAGVEVDRIGGCSIGALVGGLYARGWESDRIYRHMVEEFVRRKPLGDYTAPMVALLRGQRGREMVERSFGPLQIEEFEREFFCISCDLLTSQLVVHRSGPAFVAVGASMALPGILPPVPEGRRLHVDGGVLNNLPVEAMTVRGEGPVLAIDITAQFEAPSVTPASGLTTTTFRDRARAAVLGMGAYSPLKSTEILMRTITLGSIDTAEAAKQHADLTIAPDVAGIGMLAWGEYERTREAGREAAQAVLEAHTDLVDSWRVGH